MRTSIVLLCGLVVVISGAARAGELKSGQAAGTFTSGGKTVQITHAAVFVDRSDERKPTILILSDTELPASGWKSESDYVAYRTKHKFLGIAFWLDANREDFRTEYYDASSFPTSASGMFELTLDASAPNTLSGSAKSTGGAAKLKEPVKLETTFNVALK